MRLKLSEKQLALVYMGISKMASHGLQVLQEEDLTPEAEKKLRADLRSLEEVVEQIHNHMRR